MHRWHHTTTLVVLSLSSEFVFVKYVNFISPSLRCHCGNAFISRTHSRAPWTCSLVSANNSIQLALWLKCLSNNKHERWQGGRFRSWRCQTQTGLFPLLINSYLFSPQWQTWSHTESMKLKERDLFMLKGNERSVRLHSNSQTTFESNFKRLKWSRNQKSQSEMKLINY